MTKICHNSLFTSTVSSYPDDFNEGLFDVRYGKKAEAFNNVIDREYHDLLDRLVDERPAPKSGLTISQRFISDLIAEEELDGTIFAAIKAAAMHLKSRKSMTAEQVGQVLIDALNNDLDAIAERNAADGE